MSRLDSETKRKLREMGVTSLVDAFEAQDDALTIGVVFEERIKIAVDDAHAAFTHSKVEGLVRRAGLRYPNADLRRVDMLEQRGLDRGVIAQLGTCQFITQAAERRVPRLHRVREVLPRIGVGEAGVPAPLPGALHPHARPRGILGGRGTSQRAGRSGCASTPRSRSS